METMRFSSRVDISEPNPIAKAEAEAKTSGITLGKLNDSNPTKHALAPELLPDIYGAEPRGQRYAREALTAFLQGRGNDVAVEDLYILSSTSEAYSWLIKLLCDAGDAVLAPKPGYPLIESIARLECVDMIEYQQRFDGSWYIDVAELREALESEEGERIRALVLINPNNPTGSYVKPSEREAIVRLCHDHEVAIIADEVFYDYDLEPFDGNARLAGEKGALTFALDGFRNVGRAARQSRLDPSIRPCRRGGRSQAQARRDRRRLSADERNHRQTDSPHAAGGSSADYARKKPRASQSHRIACHAERRRKRYGQRIACRGWMERAVTRAERTRRERAGIGHDRTPWNFRPTRLLL